MPARSPEGRLGKPVEVGYKMECGDLPGTAGAVCCTAAVAGEPRRPARADEFRSSRRSHGHHRRAGSARRQLTYDYLDVVTGQVDRGRVVPPTVATFGPSSPGSRIRAGWPSPWRA